jgi:hypothetical protein
MGAHAEHGTVSQKSFAPALTKPNLEEALLRIDAAIKVTWSSRRAMLRHQCEVANAAGTLNDRNLEISTHPSPRQVHASQDHRTHPGVSSLEGVLVVGNLVTRRSLIAWCAAIGLGGCAEDAATKAAQDPYLPTMRKDLLYTWRPAGNLSRAEALFPRSTDNFASGTAVSGILVTFALQAAEEAQSLCREAVRIALNEGYTTIMANADYMNGSRILMDGVSISCVIEVSKDSKSLYIVLNAPE